jgi:hypothetical protein
VEFIMDIQKLLDEVTKYGQAFDAESHPKDFEAICVKLIMKDQGYFKENLLDHLAEMTTENMERLHERFYGNYDDLTFISAAGGDTPLSLKLINTYATSLSVQSGHAMGYMMEAYQAEVIKFVKSNLSVWWDDLCGYVYEMDERASHVSLVRDGEL